MTGEVPTVRRATIADLDTVVALRIALLREYPDHPVYGRLRPDAEVRAHAIFGAQLESENEVVFLAEHANAVIGLLRCVETVSSPLLEPERYCYISSVYVSPDWRRKGVLRSLFASAQDWCRKRGLPEMRLHNVGTRAGSAAAWDALGFEVIEQVRIRRVDVARKNAEAVDARRGTRDAARVTRTTPDHRHPASS